MPGFATIAGMSMVFDPRRIRFGCFEVLPARRMLLRGGHRCDIGGRAFDLLLVLLRHRDRAVSVQELMDLVWPGLAVEPNNVQVQVWALRRLLGRHAIVTIPRRGYRLVEAVSVSMGAEGVQPVRRSRPQLRWNSRVV